jgi:hypothetical protein
MAILETNHWSQGHLAPWWGYQHRLLDYKNEPFNDPVTQELWRKLGYTQTKFTGDMYDMRNPEPPWMKFFRGDIYFEHFSWSVYRMEPGTTIPEHRDTYSRFREIYNIDQDQDITRAIVFLEDWDRGHYLELDGNPIVQWRAGDWVCWKNDLPHIAANIGSTERYTLQITGI